MLKNSFILLLTAILFSCGSQEGDISEMKTPNSKSVFGGGNGQCAAITGPSSACLHDKQIYKVDCTTATSGNWFIDSASGCINPIGWNLYGTPIKVEVIFSSSSGITADVNFQYTSLGNNWIDYVPVYITSDCQVNYCN